MVKGRKKVFHPGERFGMLTIVRNLPLKRRMTGPRKRQVRVRCDCGTEFVTPTYYLMRGKAPKRDCGCTKPPSLAMQFKREHGIWTMMNYRCQNPKHTFYKYYGGRGISVCPEWHKLKPEKDGFKTWFEYMGPAPTPKHSIDRIDNDGNYEPGNVRWATAKEQQNNTSRSAKNKKPFLREKNDD